MQKHENENQMGLLEMVSGGLMAPEEAASKGCQASEQKSPETWMKGDCCYESAESKINAEDTLKKTTKYNRTRTYCFQIAMSH